MKRSLFVLMCVTVFCAVAVAQTVPVRRVVRASGQASVSAQPDQARINVGVITRASTAEQAASQNASQVEAVLTQLRQVVGPGAQIKTINYSLRPDYRHSSGMPPVLTGYTASNTVEVTIEDLSLIGRVIDAASQAGANTLHGLRFTLKDPEPLRAEALGLAAEQARAHAEAIASGLGRRIGAVLVAQEGAIYDLGPSNLRDAGGAVETPIEAGLVQVHATVTVEVAFL